MDRDKVARAIKKAAPEAGMSFDQPMKAMTSLRIGGPADLLITPGSLDATAQVVSELNAQGLGFTALGGGTNLLVRDAGIRGAVIHLAGLDELRVIDESTDTVRLMVGAGLPMNRLLGYTRKEGLSGIEGMSGIPGLVGGAIAGNAGSFGVEIMDVVISVEVIGSDGTVKKLDRAELSPAYRSAGLPAGATIVGATLGLRRAGRADVAAAMDGALKKKSATQPLGKWSAGCVFKNPPGDSSGRLIDEAGLKGLRVGAIEVSNLHAGFFINTGSGTSEDFMRLMEKVSVKVMKDFNVELEPEIKVVGNDA